MPYCGAEQSREMRVKGLVFTTFLDFSEGRFGPDMVDDAIQAAALPNGGAYTSVGTYPFEEMVSLISKVVQLSGETLPNGTGELWSVLLLDMGQEISSVIPECRPV